VDVCGSRRDDEDVGGRDAGDTRELRVSLVPEQRVYEGGHQSDSHDRLAVT